MRAERKLTKARVQAAKPQDQRFWLWDSEVRGFGVYVMPSGHRSFYVQWGDHGRTKRVLLGSFPEVSVEAARQKAAEHKVAIRQGHDPEAELHRGLH